MDEKNERKLGLDFRENFENEEIDEKEQDLENIKQSLNKQEQKKMEGIDEYKPGSDLRT